MARIEAMLEESGGELTPEIEQEMQENEESLRSKVDAYSCVIRKLSAQSLNIGNEIKRLQEMKRTTDNSVKRIKEHILNCMEVWNIKKLEGETSKFYTRDSATIDVDEEKIIAPYEKLLNECSAKLPAWIEFTWEIKKSAVKGMEEMPDGFTAGTSRSVIIK